jgi:hypothetical protein
MDGYDSEKFQNKLVEIQKAKAIFLFIKLYILLVKYTLIISQYFWILFLVII